MRQAILAVMFALAGGWAAAGEAGHGSAGKDVKVLGELVDMACFMAHEGRGAKHAKCGQQCVLGGAPLGIVTDDGKVYLLLENHASAAAKKPFAEAKKLVAEKVTISGSEIERGGVQAILVSGVTKA